MQEQTEAFDGHYTHRIHGQYARGCIPARVALVSDRIMSPLLLKKITLAILYTGYVTFYNPVGKTLSCLRHMGEPKEEWKWDSKREGVAHRWLPCGSTVYIRVGSRVVKSTVVDRGPYMAVDADGKWHNASPPQLRKWWKKSLGAKSKDLSEEELQMLSRTLPDGWRWRSVVDILYSVKPKLGTGGGRQPGQLLVTPELWETVKEQQPENDQVILPGQDTKK